MLVTVHLLSKETSIFHLVRTSETWTDPSRRHCWGKESPLKGTGCIAGLGQGDASLDASLSMTPQMSCCENLAFILTAPLSASELALVSDRMETRALLGP